MQWSRHSISWTSFLSPWVRSRDSNRDVDLAIGRPIVPAHTGRGYRAESRTFDRRVPLPVETSDVRETRERLPSWRIRYTQVCRLAAPLHLGATVDTGTCRRARTTSAVGQTPARSESCWDRLAAVPALHRQSVLGSGGTPQ